MWATVVTQILSSELRHLLVEVQRDRLMAWELGVSFKFRSGTAAVVALSVSHRHRSTLEVTEVPLLPATVLYRKAH